MSANQIQVNIEKQNNEGTNRVQSKQQSKHSTLNQENLQDPDATAQKGNSTSDHNEQAQIDDDLTLNKIKSAQELKIDFHQNEKMLTSLSFNINDLFKKINSLVEEVQNEVEANPISSFRSLNEIEPSPTKNSQWKSEQLIKEIQKEKQQFMKMHQQMMKVPEQQTPSISMKLFEVGKNIGHGKFGQVLQCRHRQTGTLYALKKIFKSTIEKYQMHEQILTEIQACKRMNHSNIIKTYTAFTDEFHIFILSEFAEGQKLVKRFNSSEGYISRIIRQVLEALAYIHESQVVHRDLKPQNIIVNEYGRVKICDFGWSSLIDKGTDMDIICGTLDYVCPQMVQKQKYTKEVDLWSIGVLVFELIYGQAPFKAETREQTFKKVKDIDFKFAGDKQISGQCQDFITKLLKPQNERMRLHECMEHCFITKYPAWQITNTFQFDNLF